MLPVLALLGLAATVLVAVDSFFGSRSIVPLAEVPEVADADAPSVTVVIAARDEARRIEEASRSVLASDYPRLEVLAMDDRSTDGTGPILDRIAEASPRLRVIHLRTLPLGWLGKNHALERGAREARGELVLFADADVIMRPSTIRRAVAYFRRHDLDHLTLVPEITVSSPALRAYVATFAFLFSIYTRPWKARDAASRASIGIGAFNLVRASSYRAAGTHARIAMRPDDDLMLGRRLKESGARQDIVYGIGLVSVEWYASLRELVHGLTKNVFAALNYRVSAVLGSLVLLMLFDVLPFVAVFVARGWARWAFLATDVLLVCLCSGGARISGQPRWTALAHPLAALLQAYLLVRSTAVTLWTGGITWRGTTYALADLKRARDR